MLNWLHISDIHVEASMSYDFSEALKALIRLAQNRGRADLHAVRPLHAIFVTGDIAAKGKQQEYEAAAHHLSSLAVAFDVPAARVFIVPGNHDVDWDRIRPYHALNLHRGDDTDLRAADRAFQDSKTLHLLEEKFEGFRHLANSFPNSWRGGRDSALVHVFEESGARIGVVGINSAWLVSGRPQSDADRGELMVGRPILAAAFDYVRQRRPDIVLTLMHHPMEWLRELEAKAIETLMGHTDLLLYGHLHRTEVRGLLIPPNITKPRLDAQAGALYDATTYVKTLTFGSWNPDTGDIYIRHFRLLAPGNDWALATEAFPLSEGIGRFKGPVADIASARIARSCGPVELRATETAFSRGNVTGPIGCVYIHTADTVLAQIGEVLYRATLDGERLYEWESVDRAARFALTFDWQPGIVIEARVVFEDFSELLLQPVQIESPTTESTE